MRDRDEDCSSGISSGKAFASAHFPEETRPQTGPSVSPFQDFSLPSLYRAPESHSRSPLIWIKIVFFYNWIIYIYFDPSIATSSSSAMVRWTQQKIIFEDYFWRLTTWRSSLTISRLLIEVFPPWATSPCWARSLDSPTGLMRSAVYKPTTNYPTTDQSKQPPPPP